MGLECVEQLLDLGFLRAFVGMLRPSFGEEKPHAFPPKEQTFNLDNRSSQS